MRSTSIKDFLRWLEESGHEIVNDSGEVFTLEDDSDISYFYNMYRSDRDM